MRRVRADLHIHTALSPCALAEMTPETIVRTAMARGLDMIAICDHNTAANVAEVQAAAGSGLAVLAGMEVTSGEEAHVVGWFPNVRAALAADSEVAASMPASAVKSCMNGCRRPTVAAALELEAVVRLIHRHSGLAVAAHLDRPSFTVFSQLGVWPEKAMFDVIEISAAGAATDAAARFESLGLPMIAASDSHSVDEIGGAYTDFEMETPDFLNLVEALSRPFQRGTPHA